MVIFSFREPVFHLSCYIIYTDAPLIILFVHEKFCFLPLWGIFIWKHRTHGDQLSSTILEFESDEEKWVELWELAYVWMCFITCVYLTPAVLCVQTRGVWKSAPDYDQGWQTSCDRFTYGRAQSVCAQPHWTAGTHTYTHTHAHSEL